MTTVGKKITCRAAVAWKVKTSYVIETVEIDLPKAGEVRLQRWDLANLDFMSTFETFPKTMVVGISAKYGTSKSKMTSAGVCHTDQHYQEGCDKAFPFPAVLGHEGAGIVESIGSGVKSVVPGDLVVVVCERYCGECKSCKNPNTNQCDNQPRNHLQSDGTSRFKCKGQSLFQLMSLSTFSEYTVLSENNVAKVNPKAPSNKIALVGCCVPTGYGAAVNCAKVKPGSTCAIWGLGGVGMNVVIGCRDSNASKIIGVDVNPNKFKLAKELGCTHVINPKDNSKSVPEILAELTDGGVDYCFVSIGLTSVMEQAFKSSHPKWGETIIIGLTEIGSTFRVGVWELLFGRKVKGTVLGSYKTRLEIPKLVEKVVKNEIQLDKLVSHLIPLDEINRGYEMLETGESIRTVVDFALKK